MKSPFTESYKCTIYILHVETNIRIIMNIYRKGMHISIFSHCIARIFGGGKPCEFGESLHDGLPNFTIQILTISLDINKESK